jgi:surface antigen
MNIEEVELLGRRLRSAEQELAQITRDIEQRLAGTTWLGPDAQRFTHQWWPEHRSSLAAAANGIGGFGQSALNQAAEQREASGVAPAGSAAPPVGSASGTGSGSSGGGTGGQALPPDRGASAVPGWFKPNSRADYAYQCTDWVRRRRENLGFGPTALVAGRWGHGGAMASMNGGTPDTPPSFGAIASYGAGTDDSPGHVMIVEEVMDGGSRIRVSEMNVGDADWGVGTADEFRSDTILERRGDAWFKGGRSVGRITFAR